MEKNMGFFFNDLLGLQPQTHSYPRNLTLKLHAQCEKYLYYIFKIIQKYCSNGLYEDNVKTMSNLCL